MGETGAVKTRVKSPIAPHGFYCKTSRVCQPWLIWRAMRDGIVALGGDADKINPLNPVDLVIDHSVMIDAFGTPRAFQMNVEREYERNMERYSFLKWGQKAFDNFRVVPPGTGICHQVNLEYLSQTVWTDNDQNGKTVAYPRYIGWHG